MSHRISEILDALRILVQSLRVASRSSEQVVGMTGAQLFVLEKLAQANALTVNELAERTHTHQSTVSVVVSKLVEKKLVSRVRSAEDARVQILSITKLGSSRLSSASESVQDRLLRSLKKLTPAEQTQLSSLLHQVITGAGLSNVEPPLFLEENGESKHKIKTKQ